MLVSLNLLKKYVDLPLSAKPEEVAAKLSTCTVEVEDFFAVGKDLANIVVGKVTKLEKHPNADKLRIVFADLGEQEPARIVCGGVNLYEGMLTAVALPGAMVRWHGEGEAVKLEKTRIRGEESEGMICASNEIGLADRFPAAESEIIDLTALDFEVGEPLAKALGLDDIIIDIDNKSITNRPDLWGHYGLARELAAIYGVGLKPLEVQEKLEIKKAKDKGSEELRVSVKDYELCSRYLGLVVKNVKVKESPLWLKNILTAVGMRPINNIVDITNYVMIETGQPMHAFDRRKVDSIVVRRANPKEKIITLDQLERELSPETLVIADSKKPIAIAGVIGGQNSQISEETQEIILEAANFDAINVRKTAQQLGLRTDASMRFEKSLDIDWAEVAMRRAAELISEILPEAELGQVIVEDTGEAKQGQEIEIAVEKINKKIGAAISKEEIVSILESLGFGVKEKKANLLVDVPSWRNTGDITIAEDLIEEIARIYGYDRIRPELPEVKLKPWAVNSEKVIMDKIRDILSLGMGMQETLNYSFWSKKLVSDMGVDKEGELLALENPLSEEQTYLRLSLLPQLLQNARANNRFYDKFGLYEIGRVFFDRKGKYKLDKNHKDRLPDQPYYLAGLVVVAKDEPAFAAIRGKVEEWAKFSGVGFIPWSSGKNPFLAFNSRLADKEKRLAITWGKEKIGWLGEVSQWALDYFEIKNKKVAVFELDLTEVLERKNQENKKYIPVAKYPVVERDVAVVIAWKTQWESVKGEIIKIDPMVKEVIFLSEYDLGKKKSLALRVVYRSDEHTLSDQEVEKVEGEIVRVLGEKFGAVRR